ncbi:MAG: hypothetical protein JRJ02_10465 [Deltaproteobacteria bacterium]|nr:hypothetical protein [Deltaproteobacteria bacterium]
MKKFAFILYTVFLVLICSGTVGATLASFSASPTPSDLYDLSHGYHYSWGMTWDTGGLPIVDATLTIKEHTKLELAAGK